MIKKKQILKIFNPLIATGIPNKNKIHVCVFHLPHKCEFKVMLGRRHIRAALWWWLFSYEMVPQYITCMSADVITTNLVWYLQKEEIIFCDNFPFFKIYGRVQIQWTLFRYKYTLDHWLLTQIERTWMRLCWCTDRSKESVITNEWYLLLWCTKL